MGYSTKCYYCRLWDFKLVDVTSMVSRTVETSRRPIQITHTWKQLKKTSRNPFVHAHGHTTHTHTWKWAFTDIKTTIEAYNEFLPNASHNSKREPPLNCSCSLTDMEHLI